MVFKEKIRFDNLPLKGYKNILNQTSSRKVWFTSDTHFGHKNVIPYCNRPWETVEEMNEALITNWNSVVGIDDIVFHLGDVQLGGGNQLMDNIFPRLNGHIILILGNHDGHNLKPRHLDLIDAAYEQLTIIIDGILCTLTHCPHGIPGKEPEHQFNLHGHLHSINDKPNEECTVKLRENHYDVGVDNNNYFPISFNDIKSKIYNRIEKRYT
jgi:calcineurin-like phosphoesterase family protein